MSERILFTVFFVTFLSLLIATAVAVIPALFGARSIIDILLVATILCAVLLRYEWALLLAVTGGLVIDLIMGTPGLVSVRTTVTVIIINALFLRFFTNRSLWTLITLGGVATIISALLRALAQWTMSLAIIEDIVLELVSHTMLWVISFATLRMAAQQLTPYFFVARKRRIA